MACGVPVIASRVAGMEDTITHDINGWLLKNNKSKTLGALIEKVLSDNQNIEKVGKAALKRSEFFSEKKFFLDIVDFYEMMIKKFNSKNNI